MKKSNKFIKTVSLVFIGSLFILVLLKLRFFRHYTEIREYDCDGENFVYSIRPQKKDFSTLDGVRFNCESMAFLKQFGLTDNSPVDNITSMKRNFPQDVVFVLAANTKYYPSLRAAIASIQFFFQQNYRKIIVYDLDGANHNSTMLNEMSSVCKLEFRRFPFDDYPKHVRDLHSFAWKILILADVFREHDMIIYIDTSIYFLENDFRDFFNGMKDNKLFHVQFGHESGHGIRFATHLNMLKYLPLHPYFQEDIGMHGAGFIMLIKSPQSRSILKWAVLCALEMDCINPRGSTITCHVDKEFQIPDGSCHRQDQSAFNILVNNAEMIAREKGQRQLLVHQFYKRRRLLFKPKYLIIRHQSTTQHIDSSPCNNLIKNKTADTGFQWIRLNPKYLFHLNVCSSVTNPDKYIQTIN